MRVPALLLLFASSTVFAQDPPALNRQDAWGEAEKKQFLRYLNSNAPVPSGQVKEIAPPRSGIGGGAPRKARYISLALVSDQLDTIDIADKVHSGKNQLGGKLLLGGHLFSWIRYYAGAQYAPFEVKDPATGKKEKLVHWMVPAGIEFALIPLGTPHTRYVLLRGGAAAHKVDDVEFFSWTGGLGYEWQIPDSRWRLHLAAEGYKSMKKVDGIGYYGLGATLGVAFTL